MYMNIKKIIKRIMPTCLHRLRHLFLAWRGAVKYGHPSRELIVIGITGTSGKSTTVSLLRQLLEHAGYRVGSLSTIDFSIAGENKLNDQKMTMLGKSQIQKYLREMVDANCDIAIVETTSEGRLQHRHKFIAYDMISLTNLYPEHIDSHGSFEKYKQAKLDIFHYISKLKIKKIKGKEIKKVVSVHGNTKEAPKFLEEIFAEKYAFGREDAEVFTALVDADTLLAKDVSVKKDGLHFSVGKYTFHAPMYGEHNVSNIMGVISFARVLGIDWKVIKAGVAEFRGVPGRVEFIPEAEEKGFQVIVDYAFEPGAIGALYEVVDLLKPARVIHVFGSTGGGRDLSRRESVGTFVGEHADICIVTDEDPYEDDPMEIIKDVAEAVKGTGKKEDKDLFLILDRGEAISRAIKLAKKGDLVLVTGKGSEQAMCVKGELVSWDDREEVKKALKK